MENNMKIEIDAKLINVSTIRLAIASFISNLKITLDEIVEIKTALSEAVTNAIEHGYNNLEEGKKVIVEIITKSFEEETIEIIVQDFGVGIEDISLAMSPEYTTKPEEEHAGMGFTIMENFMDEVVLYG
ncbi:putative uncharacterized protein [Clostridium sp. CAG:1219]|nr:putative uncharacterized protein [Clostridium sp. CAG:1219]